MDVPKKDIQEFTQKSAHFYLLFNQQLEARIGSIETKSQIQIRLIQNLMVI